jgi:hypothetical protein
VSELSLDDAHVVFVRIMRRLGQPAPNTKRLEIQEPIVDDGETDCWTHAWEVAQRTPNARYVEGICGRPGGLTKDSATHAWVEADTPFGPVLIECTPGYEDAHSYRGLVVDHRPGSWVAAETRDWPRQRASVIQGYLRGGAKLEEILAIVTPEDRDISA